MTTWFSIHSLHINCSFPMIPMCQEPSKQGCAAEKSALQRSLKGTPNYATEVWHKTSWNNLAMWKRNTISNPSKIHILLQACPVVTMNSSYQGFPLGEVPAGPQAWPKWLRIVPWDAPVVPGLRVPDVPCQPLVRQPRTVAGTATVHQGPKSLVMMALDLDHRSWKTCSMWVIL